MSLLVYICGCQNGGTRISPFVCVAPVHTRELQTQAQGNGNFQFLRRRLRLRLHALHACLLRLRSRQSVRNSNYTFSNAEVTK